MTRLYVTTEGETEELFTFKILCPHLVHFDVLTSARSVKTGCHRGKNFRGGLANYEVVKNDLLDWMLNDQNPDARFTTLFDLYALPDNFPGYAEAANIRDPYQRVALLEERLGQDIGSRRFIPYLQLHEFETLLFVDPRKILTHYNASPKAIQNLLSIARENPNPELINDGEASAPSKRIIAEIPRYQKEKILVGVDIVKNIGLDALRSKCRHFNQWLEKLENLCPNKGTTS